MIVVVIGTTHKTHNKAAGRRKNGTTRTSWSTQSLYVETAVIQTLNLCFCHPTSTNCIGETKNSYTLK